HAVVPAEHLSIDIYDLARQERSRPQPLDQSRIGARWHEADILAVGLRGDRQGKACGQRAGLPLGQAAERKAQKIELGSRRREEKIALVALRIDGTVQLRP